MTKKQAREICRQTAFKSGYYEWGICWSKQNDYYPNDGYFEEQHQIMIELPNSNKICSVYKDGRYVCPVKRSFIKEHNLVCKQKQKGQTNNFDRYIGEEWIKNFMGKD